MNFDTDITYLKGVGPQRAALLKTKGISTVEDLLYYMPFRYEDRSNVKLVADLVPGETATVVATISSTRVFRSRHRANRLFEARVSDGSGRSLVCKWFRGDYLQSILHQEQEVAFYGKIDSNNYSQELSLLHPEYEILDDKSEANLHLGRIVPVYEAAGRLNTRVIRSLIHRALDTLRKYEDPLPESLRRQLGLPLLGKALLETHFPAPKSDLILLNTFRTPAQFRLIFEEFFYLECGLALKRRKARSAEGITFRLVDGAREKIKRVLPFKPTAAQKRVLKEIATDMSHSAPMNRLLQGDVGSGKTIVSVEAAIIALENNYQVAIMAPTEILVTQHYLYFKRLLEPVGYTVVSLTGSLTSREKTELRRKTAEGVAHVVVGTHALISKDVEFQNLGLIVVDEQHRFGVMQRLELLRKGKHPDVLVMTATPIPRTLALTLYGDLDVSTIDELPPGRPPIRTKQARQSEAASVYRFVRREVETGRQAYIVCPMIEESETRLVQAAQEVFDRLSKEMFPDLTVGLLHGRLKTGEKETVMEGFKSGKTQILVSTTVIEVGVDVPNATVMVVEQAEGFGLAQLHQLRGRVGRGAKQSYCILLTDHLSEIAKQRINTLVETQNGFQIADTDLQLRGPGEFFGTRQSGLPALRVANLVRDRETLGVARSEAVAYIEKPSSEKEMLVLVTHIQERWQRRYGLVQVG